MLSVMVIPRYCATDHFPKFGCEVNNQKVYVYTNVMLMPTHSHRVTFGYIKFHSPIKFLLPKAGEIFLQDQTILE